MHSFIAAAGVVLVLMIIIHMIFRAIKFTIGVMLLGIGLIATVYVFNTYFGIDLIGIIMSRKAS